MRRGSPGSVCESQSLPGASQAQAVPAEQGTGHGLLLGPGVRGFGQTLQPSPDIIKHTLRCCRLGGRPILDALLDWKRKGLVRALPRRGHTCSPPSPTGKAGRASPWKPKAPQQRLLAASREGLDLKTIFCVCFCLYDAICVPPYPLLLQPQMDPLFLSEKASHPTRKSKRGR